MQVSDQTTRPMLTGTLYGVDRKDLLAQAGERAESYFGSPCVAVRLSGEAPHNVLAGFNATFEAQEHHDVEGASYGPGKCRGCGVADWPQRPLARAVWS